jgi:hypothetical protein
MEAFATVPEIPTPPAIVSHTTNSASVNSDSNGNGGSTALQWQIGYGTSSSTSSHYKDANDIGEATITGLTPGSKYYFRARRRNAIGWSGWSASTHATMWNTQPVVTVSDITQTSLKTTFKPLTVNGADPILESQIGWALTTALPTNYVKSTGTNTFTGLQPNTAYYFRTRSRNAHGWSHASAATMGKTIAGAYIRVGGVWKEATPYVKVAGVWKLSRPWVRILGIWKESK